MNTMRQMSLQLLNTMLLAAKITEIMSEDQGNKNCSAGVPVPQIQVSVEEKSFCISEALMNIFFKSKNKDAAFFFPILKNIPLVSLKFEVYIRHLFDIFW